MLAQSAVSTALAMRSVHPVKCPPFEMRRIFHRDPLSHTLCAKCHALWSTHHEIRADNYESRAEIDPMLTLSVRF